MVLPTDEYQGRIDNLNFRLGEILNTPHILTGTEVNSAVALLEEYRALNAQMKSAIDDVSNTGDIGNITTNIGQHQQKIKDLEKRFKEAEQELDTADARKRSVERIEQDVSYHQLYMMDRPLRQLSIPTLLTLSVVFVFAGIYFLYKIWGGGAASAGHGPTGHGLSSGAVGHNTGGIFGFLRGSNTGHGGPAAAHGNTSKGLLPTINMPSFGLSSMFGK